MGCGSSKVVHAIGVEDLKQSMATQDSNVTNFPVTLKPFVRSASIDEKLSVSSHNLQSRSISNLEYDPATGQYYKAVIHDSMRMEVNLDGFSVKPIEQSRRRSKVQSINTVTDSFSSSCENLEQTPKLEVQRDSWYKAPRPTLKIRVGR